MGVPVRKIIVLAFNILSMFLTLFTGLRENPLIVYTTGKYENIRSRLIEGAISYDIVPMELLRPGMLVNLSYVGEHYRFFSNPTRRFANVGEDRSTCMRVNSVNGSIMNIYFDDFWGKGPRRTQLNLYSISAPSCKVINFLPEWVQDCRATRINPTECHRYILENFDELLDDPTIQTGIVSDNGKIGHPFLKCARRPEENFNYITDMMIHYNYWSGGKRYVQFHTSDCQAKHIMRDPKWQWSLFEAESLTDSAVVIGAIDNEGWIKVIVTFLYGIVSIGLILYGLFSVIAQTKIVLYAPKAQRFIKDQKYFRYILPMIAIPTMFPVDGTNVIHFKGSILMGSDVWMNHWLFIWLSIADSVVNVKLTYVIFQTGTWMLAQKINFENFIFMASALTKMTWLMCFIHTVIRLLMKVTVRALKALKIVEPAFREKLDWYVDASALFLSFKVYSSMLFVLLYLLVLVNGNTTFMVRQVPAKRGVFGGAPNLAKFWGSELMCDFFVLLSILTVLGFIAGTLILFTKYKYVASNSIIKLLQRRYFFVGWDPLIAMEALGIDPVAPNGIVEEAAVANCSVGSLLRQMYVSGPSGLVTLAGDYLFEDGGFSKEPLLFRYPVKRAIAMGLCRSSRATVQSYQAGGTVGVPKSALNYVRNTEHASTATDYCEDPLGKSQPDTTNNEEGKKKEETTNITQQLTMKSIFNRQLRLFSNGVFGHMLLVDETEPGKLQKNPQTALMEYVVRDALSYIAILDIKPLLGNTKKLRIR